MHGAWLGRYAWSEVRPLLEQAGHRVVAFDLHGHGDDHTPLAQLTLEAYVAATIRHIEAEAGPVVLVGHSLAGLIISQVAEAIPARIAQLVYVCAYLPRNGQSAFNFPDPNSLLPPNLVVSADQLTATIKPAALVPIFAADCSAAVQQLVMARHWPELLARAAGPVPDPGKANRIGLRPSAQMLHRTLHDVGISTNLQRQMLLANGSVANVAALDCGHSPHFARTAALVDILIHC